MQRFIALGLSLIFLCCSCATQDNANILYVIVVTASDTTITHRSDYKGIRSVIVADPHKVFDYDSTWMRPRPTSRERGLEVELMEVWLPPLFSRTPLRSFIVPVPKVGQVWKWGGTTGLVPRIITNINNGSVTYEYDTASGIRVSMDEDIAVFALVYCLVDSGQKE